MTIVSPHLDDAVFSAFGIMLEQSSVKIISVFAGVPKMDVPCSAYDRLTSSKSPHERYLVRRLEDSAVIKSRNWECVQLDFLDKPYRSGSTSLLAISMAIRREFSGSDVIVIPAAVGSHGDHITARDASLLALADSPVDKYMYADIPYASYYGWPPRITNGPTNPYLDIDAYWEEALASVRLTHTLNEPLVFSLDQEAKTSKVQAMRAYASQFPAIEGGPSAWLTHEERIGFEVFWRLESHNE